MFPAGKSTLLRMTRIATILAQIGCYVPAESAAISPVDRICTCIGAWFAPATFKVEVYDARKFIHEATSKSLVILEELGRDTTTFDGHSLWLILILIFSFIFFPFSTKRHRRLLYGLTGEQPPPTTTINHHHQRP